MKKQIILLAIAVISSLPLLAQQRPHNQERMQRMRSERPERQDFLSEEQKEQMKGLREEHMKASTPLHNQLKELRARQNSLMSVESPDRGEINEVLDEINELQGQLQKLSVDQRLNFRELLTEEQRVKVDAMKARRPGMGTRANRQQREGFSQRNRMMRRR